MRSPLAFLKFGVKASLNAALFGVGGDFVVEVLPNVARDVWNWWGKDRPPEALRAEAQAVAQLPDAEVRRLAEEAVAQEAAGEPEPVRQALTAFLAQVPAAIRQASRRPADPSGRTLAHTVSLGKPEDLLPFLPARMPRFKPGDRPGGIGDWELVECLGVGGFGEVWKARKEYLGEEAALKFCLDEKAAQALHREAVLLGRVQREGRGHAGIVQLRHTYLKADTPCLEYEYVAGGDLAGLIGQWHRSSAPNLVEQSARLMHSLAQIVAFAHRLTPPIVHRDLKPANILLQPSGVAKITPRVADFGIGAVAAQHRMADTRHGTTGGEFLLSALRGSCTPLYASPEQKRGGDADPRDDVYALGVIWFHLLTGDLTLEVLGDWQVELERLSLPAPMLRLLGECLASRAERRLADAGVLAERLAALLAGAAPPAEPPAAAPDVRDAEPTRPAEDDLMGHVQRTLGSVQQAHAEARHLAEEQHDYSAAAQALEGVPEHLRDALLYASLCERRDRVGTLDQAVRAAARDMRLSDLRSAIEELLELAPQRQDLRKLLQTLPPRPREFVNSIGMKFVLIPRGTFVMGSPDEEAQPEPREGGGLWAGLTSLLASSEDKREVCEGPQHEVHISQPFYLGVFPVTQGQYQKVMRSNPSYFCPAGDGQEKVRGLDTRNFPVECVSWQDAVAFCKKLSEMADEKKANRRYLLPAEAEWEHACRGGSACAPFHFGPSLSSLQANFDGRHPCGGAAKGPYLARPTPVGSYPPNTFGLFDMHGNVLEWCADWFSEGYYSMSPDKDPPGPKRGEQRVLRGGSWNCRARRCRCAARGRTEPETCEYTIGFRVVCLLP
jgi:formylglycine-generating enzyme required for sulfatase activity/serine/threonine protein kinase